MVFESGTPKDSLLESADIHSYCEEHSFFQVSLFHEFLDDNGKKVGNSLRLSLI